MPEAPSEGPEAGSNPLLPLCAHESVSKWSGAHKKLLPTAWGWQGSARNCSKLLQAVRTAAVK
eukprot:9352220-Alexandrium_andersonii.AAC.1